ncbi:hypothetical protein JHU04_002961 [Brenneria sp. 4F2]|nr:hypothetical protein [Brenneria bubanii]
MDGDNFYFYEDDEGVSVNIIFDVFNESEVQVIYLESESSDKKVLNDINFIVKNQDVFFKLSVSAIHSYVYKIYKSKDMFFKLVKIYIFPDVKDEFGFVFRWGGDTEHGIGIKFSGLSVKGIGGSSMAFL